MIKNEHTVKTTFTNKKFFPESSQKNQIEKIWNVQRPEKVAPDIPNCPIPADTPPGCNY